MRGFSSMIPGILLLAPALLAQGIDPGITRQLTAVSEMGHAPIRPAPQPRPQTFEERDDPTVAVHRVSPHQPLPAARKAAAKAERLAQKKQHREAIAKYRQAVAVDPLYFQAWNNLALELSAAGQADEAERVFRRLIDSNPEHVVVFTNLATLLSGQNRFAEAETVARQAMALHSNSFSANFVLGSVLVNQGKLSDEAKVKLQYAQVKYPEAKSLLDHWPDTSQQ
jgi:tetratricopeptide (TPR) repeat protein